MKSPNDLALGECRPVGTLDYDGPIASRLMAMGVLPGSDVSLRQIAPLGDPIALDMAGQTLGLRRTDASCIRLK